MRSIVRYWNVDFCHDNILILPFDVLLILYIYLHCPDPFITSPVLSLARTWCFIHDLEHVDSFRFYIFFVIVTSRLLYGLLVNNIIIFIFCPKYCVIIEIGDFEDKERKIELLLSFIILPSLSLDQIIIYPSLSGKLIENTTVIKKGFPGNKLKTQSLLILLTSFGKLPRSTEPEPWTSLV